MRLSESHHDPGEWVHRTRRGHQWFHESSRFHRAGFAYVYMMSRKPAASQTLAPVP